MAFNYDMKKTGMPKVTVEFQTRDFNKFLQRFLGQMDSAKASLGLSEIAMDMLKLIMGKTPVDTGRARAAWYVSMNKLTQAVGGGGEWTPKTVAHREGYARGKFTSDFRGPKKSIQMSNAVQYIMPLEFGYSTQAPYGMVRITMALMSRSRIESAVFGDLVDLWNKAGKRTYTHWRAVGATKRNPYGDIGFSGNWGL